MAVWELALVIFAVTYAIVNLVVLDIYLKLATKLTGFIDKAFKISEKMMSKYEKELDDDEN